jgi:cytochrome P450
LDLLVAVFKADQRGILLDMFCDFVQSTGRLTHEQYLLGNRGINTTDGRNIEAVLSTQFTDFGLGARSASFRTLLGHGIFTTDGEAWKKSRDLLRPQFRETRSQAFADIQDEVEKLVVRLESTTSDIVDLQPLFFRLTLDTTMAVLFGKSLNSLGERKAADERTFAEAFDHAQHVLAMRGRLGGLYWLIGGRKFWRSCKIVHDFVDAIVAEALEESNTQTSDNSPPRRYVFLQALISSTRDPIALRDQCVNVLLAGRDTTACLLSWTFSLLALYKDDQERLRSECTSLPSFKSGTLPTPTEIKGMKYLEYVLKEVLRLYPSVPVNSRAALKATVLPFGGGPGGESPILVRKGEAVGYSPYVIHRRPDIYGEDASGFRPERWDANHKEGPSLKNVGWAYIPFNGGPRICPGQEFALLEASYAIIRLLQTFRSIEAESPYWEPDRQKVTLVVSNAKGCKVRLTT